MNSSNSSVAELLQWGVTQLQQSDTARLDATVLLADVLRQSRTWLYTWPEYEVPLKQQQQFQLAISKRQHGVPVAYITGSREFWSLQLSVNEATLIPRPETELLVEKALQFCQQNPVATIIDLGTGSGAIALALASELDAVTIYAADRSVAALQMAQHNRDKYQLKSVHFLCCDWFSGIRSMQCQLIVANPPYVEEDSVWLQQGDVRFEPASALVSGGEGLNCLRTIIAAAAEFLSNNGCLMLEHGYNQAQQVQQMLRHTGYEQITTYQDVSGLDRMTCGVWRTQ